MRFSIAILLLATIFVVHAKDKNNYDWGVIGQNDQVICNETVSKLAFVGLEVKKKFVFKQKNTFDALTITAIKIQNLTKKTGATATLKSGGPGSKGATIEFVSARSKKIKDRVIIYGR